MKICIPVTEKSGLQSAVSRHFGRAPFHYIVDTAAKKADLLIKPEGGHGHCVPVNALVERGVNMVLCAGIGRGAAANFLAAGIPVMRTSAATVQAALDELESGTLAPIDDKDLCAGGEDHDHCHE